MRIHHLKTHPEPFRAVRSGLKTFEFRKDDRTKDAHGAPCDGYRVNDTLILQEWSPDMERITGRVLVCVVMYKVAGPAFGVPEGYCVLSLALIPDVVPIEFRRERAEESNG